MFHNHKKPLGEVHFMFGILERRWGINTFWSE